MGEIADLSALLNRQTGGNSGLPEKFPQWIDPRIQANAATAGIAGRISSLWRYNKTNGQNAAIPTTVATPNRTTLGALGQIDPTGGRQKWLTCLEAIATLGGVLMLYDRLLHIGGLDGTVTSAQTVGGTIGRYTSAADCVGNQIWLEIYTIIGVTGTTFVVNYSDQGGGAGVSPAVAIGNTGLREAERIIPVPLADGDTGVTAVTDVDLLATTGTAGNFGITVARPLAYLPLGGAGLGAIRDFIAGAPSTPEIKTDACLAFAWFAAAAGAPGMYLNLHMIED